MMIINTKTDVQNLLILALYQDDVREYIRKLMDERKGWIDGVYQDNPNSTFFLLGFTEAEGLELVPDYVDPPEPAAPLNQEEQEALALESWRNSTSCGPLQIRRALRASELMALVQGYISTAPEEIREAWEYASEFKRMDPFVLAVQGLLERTDEQVDDLFRLAQTF